MIEYKRAIILDSEDNVATVLENVVKGDLVYVISKTGDVVKKLRAKETVPFRFKIAIKTIDKNGRVLKYGETIGLVTKPILEGESVHIHNVRELTHR
jgi:hypothetical protein